MTSRDRAVLLKKLQAASKELSDGFRTAAHHNTDPELVRHLIAARKALGDAIGRLTERPTISLQELMS